MEEHLKNLPCFSCAGEKSLEAYCGDPLRVKVASYSANGIAAGIRDSLFSSDDKIAVMVSGKKTLDVAIL